MLAAIVLLLLHYRPSAYSRLCSRLCTRDLTVPVTLLMKGPASCLAPAASGCPQPIRAVARARLPDVDGAVWCGMTSHSRKKNRKRQKEPRPPSAGLGQPCATRRHRRDCDPSIAQLAPHPAVAHASRSWDLRWSSAALKPSCARRWPPVVRWQNYMLYSAYFLLALFDYFLHPRLHYSPATVRHHQ